MYDKDYGVTVTPEDVVNEILPFCDQGVDGRDLLPQAAYAADVQRHIGHQPGIARQELANKHGRQVAHMAAGLAQFLSRRYAQGVKDDGDLDKIEAALVSVIVAICEAQLPGIATTENNGLVHPDGVTISIDAAGKISVVRSDKYEVGEFYAFRHPTLRPNFAPAQGGLISGMWQGRPITDYPIWQYLQTSEGRLLLKTEAEWQAMTRATWHTCADGTKIGWDGIGGAPFLVQDLGAGTLRMPDLRGMHMEAAGFNALDVGGSAGDVARRVMGWLWPTGTGAYAGGVCYPRPGVYGAGYGSHASNEGTGIDTARVVPTGPANAPRRWGALACVYLGTPAA